MAGFEKINFSLSDDSASGNQSRLRSLTRDASRAGPSGFSPEATDSPVRRAPPSAETASRLYLQTYLEDAGNEALATIASPNRPELVPDLRVASSTSVDPLLARSVVFEQTSRGIPVFGGRVVVDVDARDSRLVSINGQVATVPDTAPIAEISAREAQRKAEEWASKGELSDDDVPQLNWYFDEQQMKWHLVWHFESVRLVPPMEPQGDGMEDDHAYCLNPSPRSRDALMDVFVDAIDGKVVFYFPSTPCLSIPIPMTGDDVDGLRRDFFGLQAPNGYVLSDPLRNIVTYDYGFQDIDTNPLPPLPPGPIQHPQQHLGGAHPDAVSAHFNATAVFDFFNDEMKRDGIDDQGMELVSVVRVWSSDGNEAYPNWTNASWWRGRMWYGQQNGRSLARYLDVIAHELAHGVTQTTSNIVYRNEPGALNESYSDIFGVIIANWYPNRPEPIANWGWELGSGLGRNGGPLRDFSDPTRTRQPDHYSNFVNTTRDYGGVHINSGIHNKAIHNLLTGTDATGTPTFPVREAAMLLYLTLTRLGRTSDFADSRRTLENVTRAFFSGDPATRSQRLAAINTAFTQVGL